MTKGTLQYTQQVYRAKDGRLHVDTTIEGARIGAVVRIPRVSPKQQAWVLEPTGELTTRALGSYVQPPILSVQEIHKHMPQVWPDAVTTIYSFTVTDIDEYVTYALAATDNTGIDPELLLRNRNYVVEVL